MKKNLAILTDLVMGNSIPILTDMRKIKTSTHEAREFAAGSEYTRVVSTLALLTSGVAGTVLANLFMNFSKPRFPTKMFTSEATAITWLKQFVEQPVEQPIEEGA